MKEYMKIFLGIIAGIIGFIFISIPAENWLPFAGDFPAWMVETPILWTLMRSGPIIFAAVFITVLIFITRRFAK